MNSGKTTDPIDQDRRRLLGTVALGIAVAGAATVLPLSLALAASDAIRPFRVNIPEADLADLRRRILATRWPDQETVSDQSQGAQLEKLQQLVRYWGTGYDWRRAEAKLNAFPQFVTEIDGVDVHFIHVRSRHRNALPVIVTHGWPGSSSSSRSSIRSRIQPRTEATPRTPLTSSSRPCRATASPAGQRTPVGTLTELRGPGRS